MTVSLISSGMGTDFTHNGEILPIDPLYLHGTTEPAPRCFIYPPKLKGYIKGRKMPVQVGWGAVHVARDPGDTSWSAGPGNIIRKGEVIGRIIRDPRFGWRLLDLAGHTMEYGIRHHDVVGAAHWRIPGAEEQRAYLAAVDAAPLMAAE